MQSEPQSDSMGRLTNDPLGLGVCFPDLLPSPGCGP